MSDIRKRRRRHKERRASKSRRGTHVSEIWDSLRARWPDDYAIPDPAFVEVLVRWRKKRGGD